MIPPAEFDAWLPDYAEGRLVGWRRGRMESAIRHSPECARLYRYYLKLEGELENAMAAPKLSTDFTERVLRRIHEVPQTTPHTSIASLRSAVIREFQSGRNHFRPIRRTALAFGLLDWAAAGSLLAVGLGAAGIGWRQSVAGVSPDVLPLALPISLGFIWIAGLAALAVGFAFCRSFRRKGATGWSHILALHRGLRPVS